MQKALHDVCNVAAGGSSLEDKIEVISEFEQLVDQFRYNSEITESEVTGFQSTSRSMRCVVIAMECYGIDFDSAINYLETKVHLN